MLGNASNGAMRSTGQYHIIVYIVENDIKVTILIVEGLNEDFIIRMTASLPSK